AYDGNIMKSSILSKYVANAQRSAVLRERLLDYSPPGETTVKKCGRRFHDLIHRLPPYKPTGSFLVTVCNGGLNQQRGAIVNAVVLARFLNLTLVVPFLKAHPVWGDSSSRVISPEHRYVENVKPSAQNSSIVLLSPFARRLGNFLPESWQLFRCKVNYEGLRFVNSILVLGRKVIRRMKKMSSNFVSLHWRFETDAVAYSMCEFGGGEKEKLALEEELGPLEGRASALAAIDYIVSTESDIFIPTATGNFPNFVIGHR
ncbi:unnamed protein product, partial [Closterium sp. NIES-54]